MNVSDEVIRAAFEKWILSECGIDLSDKEFSIHDGDNLPMYDIPDDDEGALTVSAMLLAFRAAFSIAVPDGWKVVPVEATRDMITSGNDSMAWDCCTGDASDAWRAMIIDAPQPDYTK